MKQSGIINIKGREYTTVAKRVADFRNDRPAYAILTEIIYRDKDEVVIKATILDHTGKIVATGHAEEQRKSSQINATSAMENCETSAIGRALAAFGYGGSEFASANEVQNAVHQQKGNITPNAGAWDGISAEKRTELELVASVAREHLKHDRVYDAYEVTYCYRDNGDIDSMKALWTLLDSAEKRRLKEYDDTVAEKAGGVPA